MARMKYLTRPIEQTTMPTGVPYIIGNEAAERFSFYGMKTLLAVFMTKHLLNGSGDPDPMTDDEATAWVHNFVTASYCFPIVGAILSDWLFGKYRTILWLSLLYCVGHAVLALMDFDTGFHQKTLLAWGLGLIAVGAGGIKPCVSAHVGDQFSKSNAFLLPLIFGWFYFAINFGSTISTLLTPWVAKRYGYSWAFGIPGILMAVATFVFWLGRHRFVHVPPSGKKFFEETFRPEGIRAMKNLIPLFLFVAMFWSLFDQTGSRWVLQAQRMDRQFGGWSLTPDQLQAINPLLVMILIPFTSFVLYPLLGRLFRLTELRKIGIGMFLVLPSFVIPAWIEPQLPTEQTVIGTKADSQTERSLDARVRSAIHMKDLRSTIVAIDIDRSGAQRLVTVHSVAPERLAITTEELAALDQYVKEQTKLDFQLKIEIAEAPTAGWQILAYLFMTLAEVMISITCLEFSYTQAPYEMKSFIMGLYMLFSVAVGNQFTARVNALMHRFEAQGQPLLEGASYYWFFTGCMAVTAVLYVFWSMTYRGERFIQSGIPVSPETAMEGS